MNEIIAILQPWDVFHIIAGFLWELRWWIFLIGAGVSVVLMGLEREKDKKFLANSPKSKGDQP